MPAPHTLARIGATLPDFEWIRRNVPIEKVAKALDLCIQGGMARCWRPDRHEHGDRTPSVGLNRRKNKAKCFVCDPRSLSPIDLVASVLEVDLATATSWIADRFATPTITKRRRIAQGQRWAERFRAGTGNSRLEFMVKSGIWGSLDASQKSILGVLDAFATGDAVTISYRGIARFSGIVSHSTIARGIKRLLALHVLAREERKGGGDGLRECNSYRWTVDDKRFLDKAEEAHHAQQAEILAERELQAKARKTRRSALAHVHATPRLERVCGTDDFETQDPNDTHYKYLLSTVTVAPNDKAATPRVERVDGLEASQVKSPSSMSPSCTPDHALPNSTNEIQAQPSTKSGMIEGRI